MSPTDASPFQLNIELGGEFLLAVIDRHGVTGWNRWKTAMVHGGRMPLAWQEDEAVPAVWYWMEFGGIDLSGRNLDGIDLGLASLQNAKFDDASLVGAELGCCQHSTFRSADLRQADFGHCDISGCDFSGAILDGIKRANAGYDFESPPTGLPEGLLRLCRAATGGIAPVRIGCEEVPVPIKGSLTTAMMP